MLSRILTGTLAVLLPASSVAQSTEDLVASGKMAYRSFECAHLAASQQDEVQKSRLFRLGLDEARKVANGFADGRVTQNQLSEGEVLVTFYLDGPSADFIAGRIYEGAGDNVWLLIKSAAGDRPSIEDARQVTSRLYRDKNCELIGLGR